MDFTTFKNIIGGQPRDGSSTHHGINPLDQTKLWDVPVASAQDVEDAVAAAQNEFREWRRTSYSERVKFLERFADLYLEHAEQFSQLLAAESGQTPENAAIEVHWAAQWLHYPSKYDLEEEQIEDNTKISIITHEPFGVAAAIYPSNFQLIQAIGKLAPAVAAGNCVILKPSPFAPYTTLKLAELAQRVFPPSVVQALSGGDDLGKLLVQHPGIPKISFTGSTGAGKEVLRAAAEHMKRVTLETAGNNAAIILPDVDVHATSSQLSAALWYNAGQICISAHRIYVHASILDAFVKTLVEDTKSMTANLRTQVGPVQNRPQFDRLRETLERARAHAGVEVVAGGAVVGGGEKGLFVEPTILKNPAPESGLVVEEHFGPIVSCIPYSSVDEAVEMANSEDSGLSALVFSKDASVARNIAARLDVGNVYINGPPQPDPHVPYGGHKQSGLGVVYGREGLLSWCQTKSTHICKGLL